MIQPCRILGDRCITHGHDLPCPDRRIMTIEEYEDLRSQGLIQRPDKGDTCYVCEGIVRMITCGEDSWELRCRGCGFLWGED